MNQPHPFSAPLEWRPPRPASSVAGWFVATSWVAAGGAFLVCVLAVLAPFVDGVLGDPRAAPAWLLPRTDLATGVMLVLVNFVGFVLLRYAGSYLGDNAGAGRFLRWMLATLTSVNLLILTDNLVILAMGWLGAGLSLHRLLTHFADRPAAQLAAHKKFLVSRMADLLVFAAIGLIFRATGSLSIAEISALDQGVFSGGPQLAAVLLVLAVALKSAQLPFHGWITQVMEAPTPVSALLHAGVVNIGGLVLIRLAPLMVAAPVAQALLVAIGSLTAATAGLVMTTRVSVKVMLAWSTIAQMGFMLVQCGLGAYELALLHIVAHSLYKAHAFLASGSAVERWGARQFVAPRRPVPFAASLLAAVLCLGTVAGVGAACGVDPGAEPAILPLGLVLGLAIVPLVTGAEGGWRRAPRMIAPPLVVVVLYFTWHAVFTGSFQVPSDPPGLLPVSIVALTFTGAFLVQAALRAWPDGALAQALQPRLFAGLYLDELFTRLAFRVWPPPTALPRESVS